MPGSPSSPGRARLVGLLALVGLLGFQIYALYLAVPSSEQQLPYLDKFAHVAMFATPAALAVAMRLRWVLLPLVIHALLSEPLQSVVTTTRNVDAWDTGADLLGIVMGVVAGRQWNSNRPRLETRGRR